ncbi:YqaJ viral recombinase family protein [Curvibacter sp. HBC61]|uniref:YqaJ viral recombinase family protein n=1 Tax=Curvibacter cyanobacteriorum TaxID=3026422 RepID=A0ABT5MUZ5_9BURK|nr:lambda exonuclease family protein [Curvibacter sp. HBC61]MDD0837869.1 YqaJ viral recombinase family protein [Curvibacter sp. HBC61]
MAAPRCITYDGDQQDAAWRALRLGCATGSGFAFVLAKGEGKAEAVTRKNYRVRQALELFTGEPEGEGFTTWAIKQGIEREPIGRMAFEVATGFMVDQVSFMRLDHPFLRAGVSPDGLIESDAGFELKCPTKAVHLEYLQRRTVPPEYVAQVQGNLWITGRRRWAFASFNPDFPPELQLHWFWVERDEAYIQRLEDEVWKFTAEVNDTVKQLQALIDARRVAAANADQVELAA